MGSGFLLLLFMGVMYPLMVVPLQIKLPFLPDYPLDYYYAPRYMTLAVMSIFALAILLKEKTGIRHRAFIPIGVFLFFALIASSLGAYPLTAWMGAPFFYTGFFSYIFCIILFLLACREDWGIRLIPPMVAVAAFVSLLTMLQVLGVNLVPQDAFHKGMTAYGTMGNPDYYGTYAAFMLPAAFYLYITSEERFLWLAAAAVIYGGLLVSFTWGAWLGGAVGGLFIAVQYFSRGQKKHWFILGGTLSAITLIFAVGNIYLDLQSKVGIKAPLAQIKLWKKTLEFFTNSWSFGIGPDHLYHVRRMLSSSFMEKSPSMYLEIAVTLGIFALATYVFFIGYVLVRGSGDELAAMIIVYLVQGLFHYEGIHLMPLFWIVLGLSLARSSVGKKTLETSMIREMDLENFNAVS
ncbi:hypothetical protein TZ02_10435 [Clostridium aceticum]|nr:hypothetical protein TZ02_10435 [Clostridium aceticum]